jgi:hypothetical protein
MELAGMVSEYDNNIIFGLSFANPTFNLQIYQRSSVSTLIVGKVIPRYQWIHATFTLKKMSINDSSATVALHSLYINAI